MPRCLRQNAPDAGGRSWAAGKLPFASGSPRRSVCQGRGRSAGWHRPPLLAARPDHGIPVYSHGSEGEAKRSGAGFEPHCRQEALKAVPTADARRDHRVFVAACSTAAASAALEPAEDHMAQGREKWPLGCEPLLSLSYALPCSRDIPSSSLFSFSFYTNQYRLSSFFMISFGPTIRCRVEGLVPLF